MPKRRSQKREASLSAILGKRVAETAGAAALRFELHPPDGRGDLWRLLGERLDPSNMRPRLADDIEIEEFPERWGPGYAMIANPRDLVHYRVELSELQLVRAMDGTRSLKELVLERFQDSGDLELDGIVETVRQLEAEGFLDHAVASVDDAVARALSPRSTLRQRARNFLTTLSIEWAGADRPVAWLYNHGLKWLFRTPVAAACVLLVVVGFVAFLADVGSGRFSMTGRSLGIGMVVLLVLDYLMVFVHELGHALVLTHNGRRVKSAGFMIYFGSPAFFVDASDGLMMAPRQRMLQSFGGPYAQMIVAGISAILAWAFPGWFLAETFFRYAVLNYLVLTLNLIPLLELDGYHILSDLIQVPDLRQRSFSFARHDLWHKLRSRERLSRREILLALYAFLGVAFTVFSFYTAYFYWRTVFADLIRRLWRSGTGGRVLLVVAALFLVGPVVRGILDAARSLARRVRAVARRTRFRLERRWRVEAAELLAEIPMFAEIDEETLGDLAGRVRLRTFGAGEAVVRQGDRADAFYLVRRGALHVVEEGPETGFERVLRTLTRGETFGELGLLEARTRTATVRAAGEAEAFEMDKGTFDRLLADMVEAPDFAPTLQAAVELRELPSFSHLEPDELGELIAHGEWVNVAPGEDILTQGEVGDAFYALASGRVEVLKDGKRVDVLGPGSFFGEIALLLDSPRTATIRPLTPARAYRLDREGFDRLVARAFRKGRLAPNAPVGRLWHH